MTFPINGWWIRSPGEPDIWILCPSFDAAMDDYFEGFNVPHLVEILRPRLSICRSTASILSTNYKAFLNTNANNKNRMVR